MKENTIKSQTEILQTDTATSVELENVTLANRKQIVFLTSPAFFIAITAFITTFLISKEANAQDISLPEGVSFLEVWSAFCLSAPASSRILRLVKPKITDKLPLGLPILTSAYITAGATSLYAESLPYLISLSGLITITTIIEHLIKERGDILTALKPVKRKNMADKNYFECHDLHARGEFCPKCGKKKETKDEKRKKPTKKGKPQKKPTVKKKFAEPWEY